MARAYVANVLVITLLAWCHPCVAQETVSIEQLRAWAQAVSNTGRWGSGDRIGTVNLITPSKRQGAASLVREGTVVSLAHDLIAGANPNAIQALTHEYTIAPEGEVTWGLDGFAMFPHGWAYSHLDALSHAAFEGTFYNGYGLETLTDSGSVPLGIDAMSEGIVTRGVLVDMPWLRGVDYLEPGAVVTVEDLEAWERRTGVNVGQGDVLLIRIGRWAREAALGAWSVRESVAGVHPSVALWLSERGVAALGGDASSERYPPLVDGISNPLHMLTIVAMGMPLFDNLDLEAVSQKAAESGRYTFLFMAAPLRLKQASGSAVNPLAVFDE